MKELLKRLLGINALKAQIDMLKADLERMRAENERIQMKLSGLGKYERLDLSHSQAAGVLRVMEDFKKRNFGGYRPCGNGGTPIPPPKKA